MDNKDFFKRVGCLFVLIILFVLFVNLPAIITALIWIFPHWFE